MSSRLLVFLIPFAVIAIFWVMARSEKKLAHDPTHKSFFERNGMVLGITFIVIFDAIFAVIFNLFDL